MQIIYDRSIKLDNESKEEVELCLHLVWNDKEYITRREGKIRINVTFKTCEGRSLNYLSLKEDFQG